MNSVLHKAQKLKIVWRVENQSERDNLEDQSIDRRMGSECILERLAGGV
jgi:hypothetical protein